MVSELKSEKEELEAQAEQKVKEIEDLKAQVKTFTASSNELRAILSLEKEVKEQTLNLAGIDKECREEAQSTISSLRAELTEVTERFSILFQQYEVSKR